MEANRNRRTGTRRERPLQWRLEELTPQNGEGASYRDTALEIRFPRLMT